MTAPFLQGMKAHLAVEDLPREVGDQCYQTERTVSLRKTKHYLPFAAENLTEIVLRSQMIPPRLSCFRQTLQMG